MYIHLCRHTLELKIRYSTELNIEVLKNIVTIMIFLFQARKIVIPAKYRGASARYTRDIALIDLTQSVQVNINIMPVCIDWHLKYKITPGTMGMVKKIN